MARNPSPRHAPPPTRAVRTLKALRTEIARWRGEGLKVALVPTMGALHAGHLELVRLAKRKADRAVVSIFVNPTQFAPHEDLARYPRDEAGDRRKLAGVGADLVWTPSVAIMYPEGFATTVQPRGAALPLEGEFRPHHFAGVATVCCKLFNQVAPDVAIFGEKDFQQLAVIRQTARDLDLDLTIVGAPTVREKDGLALSSRNAYLSAEERVVAPALNRALREAAAAIAKGADPETATRNAADAVLAAGFARIDYLTARDAATLAPLDPKAGRKGRLLAAAHLGRTRLIDNIAC